MITVYVDGSFIPETKEGSYGMIIKGKEETVKIAGLLGKIRDNNIAEYGAIIMALRELKTMGYIEKNITLYTDSQIILKQLANKIPPPLNKIHSSWFRQALNLVKTFSTCAIDFIGSSSNPAHTVARNALNLE